MKKAIIPTFPALIIFLISLFSCNQVQKKTNTGKPSESVDCLSRMGGFIKWYKSNYPKIEAINLVKLVKRDDSSQYRVDFENAERYKSLLRSSGFFSEQFFIDKSRYFRDCDKKLLGTKQDDGPAEGFEADLILYTQEPDAAFTSLDSLNFIMLGPRDFPAQKIQIGSADNNLVFDIDTASSGCLIEKISYAAK